MGIGVLARKATAGRFTSLLLLGPSCVATRPSALHCARRSSRAPTARSGGFCRLPCRKETAVLIDSLAFTLEKSGCLDTFWGKLDAGEDATLGVAASARPFLVAARFAVSPQPTLVVVAGEDHWSGFRPDRIKAVAAAAAPLALQA